MRKSIFYQPLAVLVAILVAAPLSWLSQFGNRSHRGGGGPFQAAAQSGSSGGSITTTGIDLWEGEARTAYVALHNLPETDRNLPYYLGRSDLRTEIRGMMFANLLGIIAKPAAERTAREQATYAQFQKAVQKNEIALYQTAINEFNRFQSDYCHFSLDPDLAKEYNLKYSGAYWCTKNPYAGVFAPPVPVPSYFKAYGFKNSYGKPSNSYKDFARLVSETGFNAGQMWGIAVGTAAAVGFAVFAGVYAALPAAATTIALSHGVTQLVGASIGAASTFTSGVTVSALGAGGIASGPAAIVFLAVITGIVAGIQTFDNDKNLKALQELNNTLASVTNNAPDLTSFTTDQTGLLKLALTFTAQTVPEVPSTAPLPSHRINYTDQVFSIAGTVRDTLLYYGWNREIWSAQTYGGWFVQTCMSSYGCPQADSLNASIRFLGLAISANGTIGVAKYTASRLGDHVFKDNWVVVKADPASTDVPCPADPATGVTDKRLYHPWWNCSTFVTETLSMVNANGFAGTFVGVSPILTPGVDPVPPRFTSAESVHSFYEAPFDFRVVTTGGSGTPAQLSVNWLPDGVAFKDNGDGTANISGKIPSGFALICTGGGACPIVSFITAKNTWGSTTQKFTYITGYAPDAVLATTTATFIAGISNAVPVLSQGEQTPVTWGVGGPNLTLAPSWLTLTDQKDGTALLSGTPPLGSVGTHPLHVSVTAIGFSPFRVLDLSANFTLNVSGAPGFVSVDPGEFHVGQTSGVHIAGSAGPRRLTAVITSGTVTVTEGAIPAGLRASQYGTVFEISGTPEPGTGGAYPLTLTATNSSGSTSRLVNLEVFEQPKITTDIRMKPNFYQGQQNSFSFTTSGYPDRGKAPIAANQPEPTDPKQGLGMYFTVTGLPSSLTYSNLDSSGYATGTLTISGTPVQADLGDRLITIRATNGVGIAAQQTFLLSVSRTVGDVDADGFTWCSDVLALDNIFGEHIDQTRYNSRADINNDGLLDWADMQLVWSNVPSALRATSQCQQATHKPSTLAVFQHNADGASTSHESTIINYISSGGVHDQASLSKGIWTGLHGSGPDLLYETWDGVLWSARVLPDGVTFQHTNPASGEVRISQVLNYRTWDGSHWKVSVIRPSW